jgi:hypothetical protein
MGGRGVEGVRSVGGGLGSRAPRVGLSGMSTWGAEINQGQEKARHMPVVSKGGQNQGR